MAAWYSPSDSARSSCNAFSWLCLIRKQTRCNSRCCCRWYRAQSFWSKALYSFWSSLILIVGRARTLQTKTRMNLCGHFYWFGSRVAFTCDSLASIVPLAFQSLRLAWIAAYSFAVVGFAFRFSVSFDPIELWGWLDPNAFSFSMVHRIQLVSCETAAVNIFVYLWWHC